MQHIVFTERFAGVAVNNGPRIVIVTPIDSESIAYSIILFAALLGVAVLVMIAVVLAYPGEDSQNPDPAVVVSSAVLPSTTSPPCYPFEDCSATPSTTPPPCYPLEDCSATR
ncbi:hypothetical protein [Nocardia sp. NBC_01327]|uniref:hypothetical protein n=1 Tax=Nocardia sp. NBC_01327 TaxID=2903593 RepID=UPI002E0F8C72|nr:hypothetical protein OG326_42290 [Nocardia sp. NBC_01327]